MVKDVREGTCWMKDYEAHIPLYEIIGSDLRAICISDFDDAKPDATGGC